MAELARYPLGRPRQLPEDRFENLLGVSGAWPQARAIRHRFELLRDEFVGGFDDLAWGPEETPTRTITVGGNDLACTDLQHWYVTFYRHRNTTEHPDAEPVGPMYEQGTAFDGPIFQTAERVLRDLLRVELSFASVSPCTRAPSIARSPEPYATPVPRTDARSVSRLRMQLSGAFDHPWLSSSASVAPMNRSTSRRANHHRPPMRRTRTGERPSRASRQSEWAVVCSSGATSSALSQGACARRIDLELAVDVGGELGVGDCVS
jgi:hypothetical protein